MKNVIYWFDEIYEKKYYLIINANKDFCLKFIKKKFDISYDEELIPALSGFTLSFDFNGYPDQASLIWIPSFKKDSNGLDVLSHELFHAANTTFLARGVKWPDHKDDIGESCAYYLGYLMRKAMQGIENLDKRKKNNRKKS